MFLVPLASGGALCAVEGVVMQRILRIALSQFQKN
jgi:hypothetical protein